MNLEEMLRDTDALTYINSLKVTQAEIKEEVSNLENMQEHMAQSCSKVRKLVRKSDNQYRLIVKLVKRDNIVASDLVIEENNLDEVEALMEET